MVRKRRWNRHRVVLGDCHNGFRGRVSQVRILPGPLCESPRKRERRLEPPLRVTFLLQLPLQSRTFITLDTYSHVLPDMQEKAVEAMEDVLGDD
jgi:hypothetical protein